MLLGIILQYLKYLQMVVFTLFTLFIINNKDDYIHKSKYCHPQHELGVTSLTINGCASTQIPNRHSPPYNMLQMTGTS